VPSLQTICSSLPLVIGKKTLRHLGQGILLGLDPTDAPLVLRDTGSSDIYALTLEEK
jgi:hypothetical protein